MKIKLSQSGRSHPFCPTPQDYTFAKAPSLCSRSVRRLCGVPYHTREIIANFTAQIPSAPLHGINQRGVSKLFTLVEPREIHIHSALWPSPCGDLAEFHGTLSYYTRVELGAQYNRGQRYVYLTWETEG